MRETLTMQVGYTGPLCSIQARALGSEYHFLWWLYHLLVSSWPVSLNHHFFVGYVKNFMYEKRSLHYDRGLEKQIWKGNEGNFFTYFIPCIQHFNLKGQVVQRSTSVSIWTCYLNFYYKYTSSTKFWKCFVFEMDSTSCGRAQCRPLLFFALLEVDPVSCDLACCLFLCTLTTYGIPVHGVVTSTKKVRPCF